MDLYEAIYLRKSAKSYLMEELDQKLVKNIENFANHLQTIIHNKHIKFKILNRFSDKAKTMEYSNSIKAPCYFVLTMEKQDGYLFDIGYIMGQLSLYLTTKELGSNLLHPVEVAKDYFGHTEEFVTVLAFGKTTGSKYKDTKMMKSLLGDKYCHYKSEVDDNIKKIVYAAGFFPYSIGPQPWRIIVYNNRIHFFCKKDTVLTKHYKKLYRIEIGMMLANIQLKAEELWLNVSAKRMDNIAEKQMKDYDYMLTVLIN